MMVIGKVKAALLTAAAVALVACGLALAAGKLVGSAPAVPAANVAAAPLPVEGPCRSVWLHHRGGEGVVYYNEITVRKSAAGTNFIACGWDRGDFGLSEDLNGRKGILFQVFDSPDPKEKVKQERVRVEYQNPTARRGNPASNSASIDFDYDWDVDKTYRFVVTAALDPRSRRTVYTGHVLSPDARKWKHVATVSTIMGEGLLRDYRSFIEGHQRGKRFITTERKAHFGNGWVKSRDGGFLDGEWTALTEAKFILAGGSNATNYNTRAEAERFLLATGGEVKNTGARWGERITCTPKKKQQPPKGIPGQ